MANNPYPAWPRPCDYPCKRKGGGWFPNRVTEDVAWPPIFNWQRINFDDDPLHGPLATGYSALIFVTKNVVRYQSQVMFLNGANFILNFEFDRIAFEGAHGFSRQVTFNLSRAPVLARYREDHLTDPPDFEPISWYREAFQADLIRGLNRRKIEQFDFQPAALKDAGPVSNGTLTNRTQLSCAIS